MPHTTSGELYIPPRRLDYMYTDMPEFVCLSAWTMTRGTVKCGLIKIIKTIGVGKQPFLYTCTFCQFYRGK